MDLQIKVERQRGDIDKQKDLLHKALLNMQQAERRQEVEMAEMRGNWKRAQKLIAQKDEVTPPKVITA